MLEGILSEWEQQLSECDQRVLHTAFGHFFAAKAAMGICQGLAFA